MKINVHTLLNLNGQNMRLEETYQLPQLVKRNKQLIGIGDVHLQGIGDLSASLFTVQAVVEGTYTLICSRCLAETEHTFNQDFVIRFNIDPSISIFAEEEEVQVVEGNQLDLLPFVEEEVLISIPNAPVCLENQCKNEILTEGEGWNLVEESSKEKRIDPRLADLAKFFEKKD